MPKQSSKRSARSTSPTKTAAHPAATKQANRRLYVLDTNVLLHDPAALFRFEEHDIHLPMVVLEELDHHKQGLSEVSRNARQVSRFLDELMRAADKADIEIGLPIPNALGNLDGGKRSPSGRLFFQTRALSTRLPVELPGQAADNAILLQSLALKLASPRIRVTLVSKDINLRIKAAIVGVHAEDYYSDRTIDDGDVLDSGALAVPSSFWQQQGNRLRSGQTAGRTWYEVSGKVTDHWRINQFIYEEDGKADAGQQGIETLVRSKSAQATRLELLHDYRSTHRAVWGVNARNREQNFALNLLLDPEIDLVTILGPAGTGKTLLTLAAGLAQTLDDKRFVEIIMTRVTIPLGEDIGFLPGTEEEKMEPWMGALMDNLEVLTHSAEGGNWGRSATQDLLRNRIKIRSLNFMRGRTFLNRYVIVDEAQNLTPKQMKALITRAGPGSKMVCLGNIAQIDTPYLTETTSGLTYVVNRFRDWPHAGHITLQRGERSRLADRATEVL